MHKKVDKSNRKPRSGKGKQMKDFEMGLAYLRKEARKSGMIADSDNDDVLVEKLAGLIRSWEPPEVAEPREMNTEEPPAASAASGSVRTPSAA